MSYNDVNSLLSGTGFHLATYDEIQSIAGISPLDIVGYAEMYNTVGGSPISDISIIDGFFEDGDGNGDGLTSEFYMYQPDTGTKPWQYWNIAVGRTDENRGAWVVETVPEPTPLALLGLGLIGVGFMRNRKV